MELVISRLSSFRAARLGLSAGLGNWLLCWILLPNLAFCALWVVATPPRMGEIIAVGAVGLIVRRARYALRLAAFAVVMAFSVVSYISAIFNLAVGDIVASMRFFAELDPLRSPTYVGAFLGMAVLLGLAARLLRRDMRFERGEELAIAVVAILSMAAIDRAVSYTSRGAYKRLPSADAPFGSAVQASGIVARADGNRHVMIVMMEAMGAPTNKAIERLMFERWRRSDIAARYDVRFGTAPYHGSTTNGELRELCGRWDEYDSVIAKADAGCLPARLSARGYDTVAVHGFSGAFFDRTDWYPNVGFGRRVFGEHLIASGMAECPGVFPGACDVQVPQRLGARLKAAKEPQFLYWLTLNSHLPVPESDALGTGDCLARNPGFPVQSGGLCRLVSVTRATSDSLAAMLVDPALPPTDILIVGDHMPPFFDHQSRSQFDSYRVPWVLLTTRDK